MPHAVFPDDGGTSTSSNGRTPSDASGRQCPASRCAANAASPARAATIVSTALDLTASGAAGAVRCVGEQRAGDAEPQSRPAWQRGSETSSDQRNKCDEKRTHLESDDNLAIGRNVRIIGP